MSAKTLLTSEEQSRSIVDVASDKLASDIVLLDISEVSGFADFFVIMTADSDKQISALTEDIESAFRSNGRSLHHREGNSESGWVLLDFSDVIVHILGRDQREFYQIEQAWSNAVQVVRIQ